MAAFLKNGEERSPLYLILSGISLVISFFDIGHLLVNAAWVAILLCGMPIVTGAAIALVTAFDVKADLLVSLALIASVAIGELFAAGEVAFIMTIGAMLEERTVAKARAGIEKLVGLSPRTARVLRGDAEEIIPAEQVQSGDTLRLLAGETIPVDGIILWGQTAIDQSIMTGEDLPVDKAPRDSVMSGTVNQFGAFDMRATKVGEDSSLQRMIRLVESADAGKAKIVSLADRWATWIVVIALVSAGATWAITGQIIRAVTILVVFCPCALVLATPTAIMAAIGNASRVGILVREGDALKRLAGVSHVAFDKTGTLTYGQPVVKETRSFLPAISDEALFQLCAQAERRSEHPIGKAIAAAYKARYGSLPEEPAALGRLCTTWARLWSLSTRRHCSIGRRRKHEHGGYGSRSGHWADGLGCGHLLFCKEQERQGVPQDLWHHRVGRGGSGGRVGCQGACRRLVTWLRKGSVRYLPGAPLYVYHTVDTLLTGSHHADIIGYSN